MAKRGRPRKTDILMPVIHTPRINLRRETKQSLAIVLFAALALLSGLALLNISGSLGALLIKAFRYTLGWGAFLLPLFFGLVAVSLYRDLHHSENRAEKGSAHSYIGVGLLTLVVITFLQLLTGRAAENQYQIAQTGEGGG